LEQFRARHNIILFLNRILHVELESHGENGQLVVTRKETYVGPCLVQFLNSLLNIFTERIGKASRSDVAELAFEPVAVLFKFKVHFGLEVSSVESL